MKKFLVLTLAIVLVLSLAVVASAAALDPYVGGRITWSYVDSDARENMPSGVYNSGIKLLLKGTVRDEATGSWGTIGAKLDAWPLNGYYSDPVQHDDKALAVSGIYEFGIDGIGGSNFNIWYTNFENEKGNQGMDRMWGINPLQTHTDCMFDRDLTDNVLGIDYVTDNVEVNFAYGFNNYDKDKDNEMSIAATFKFDGGDIHVGHYNDKDGFSEINVGGSYKLGFGTIKADYLNASVDTPGAEDASIIQIGVSVDAINFEAMVGMDDGYQFDEGGLLYDLKYKPIDNLTLCYRAAQADKEADEDNNYTNFYIGYKYGVIEARVGTYTIGEGTTQDEGVYASCYVSFW